MHIDTFLGPNLDTAAASARSAEDAGYDAMWTAETSHDPFFPLALAAPGTSQITLGTSIAVAFSRNPMLLANIGYDLQHLSKGRFVMGLGSQIKPHITKRFSMEWSKPAARMREMVLAMHAIWDCWQDGTKLDFRGDFYQHTLMTPMFSPGPNPHGKPPVFLAGVGPLMTEVAGEVCDGFFCHPFTPVEFLKDVTIPALEAGRAKSLRRDRCHRRGHGRQRSNNPQADRVLRIDSCLSHCARSPRLGRHADRAEHPVEAGRVGHDDNPH